MQNGYTFLPQSGEEVALMLEYLGVSRMEALFQEIDDSVRLKQPLRIPAGQSEFEVIRALQQMAEANQAAVCFQGFGCYDHIIPSVVAHLAGRSEFYTAYTPYQAEISQGLLQAIFEYQTMICELTGLEVSNASLYDGATAAAEACVIALNSKRRSRHIIVAGTVNPRTVEVIRTYFLYQDVEIEIVPETDGGIEIAAVKTAVRDDTAAVLVQTPNLFGYLENYDELSPFLKEAGVLLIISSQPMALGMVRSQAEWGADIAVGDAQVFGLPMSFGGPGVGYIAAKNKLLRKMPGRIVGQTVDAEGRRAFVLTLQAREQHIKRERATSNICSNQALAALTATIALASIGPTGLKTAAAQCYHKAHYLQRKLQNDLGLQVSAAHPFFNEFTLRLPKSADDLVDVMTARGTAPGVALGSYGFDDRLLTVAVTEKRTKAEMDAYCALLSEVLA